MPKKGNFMAKYDIFLENDNNSAIIVNDNNYK